MNKLLLKNQKINIVLLVKFDEKKNENFHRNYYYVLFSITTIYISIEKG
jgi:hypothetical protein